MNDESSHDGEIVRLEIEDSSKNSQSHEDQNVKYLDFKELKNTLSMDDIDRLGKNNIIFAV